MSMSPPSTPDAESHIQATTVVLCVVNSHKEGILDTIESYKIIHGVKYGTQASFFFSSNTRMRGHSVKLIFQETQESQKELLLHTAHN